MNERPRLIKSDGTSEKKLLFARSSVPHTHTPSVDWMNERTNEWRNEHAAEARQVGQDSVSAFTGYGLPIIRIKRRCGWRQKTQQRKVVVKGRCPIGHSKTQSDLCRCLEMLAAALPPTLRGATVDSALCKCRTFIEHHRQQFHSIVGLCMKYML